MSPKKKRQLVILNSAIVLLNILVFSKALLGVSPVSGTAISIGAAWVCIAASFVAFFKGNSLILGKKDIRLLAQNIHSLTDCIPVFVEAISNGDVFDDNIQQNIDQIKRFKRKHDTIKDILLQKFSGSEMSFQKFSGVLSEVEHVVFMNMRSILNKISAFDMAEYGALQYNEFKDDELTQEKISIYKEYIDFVSKATKTNEEIILKLDKMLLEISRYNSLEGGDVNKLPAIIEMDELIKNANLYK